MNLNLFFAEPPAFGLCVAFVTLLAYGGAVVAMTLTLLVRAPRPKNPPVIVDDTSGTRAIDVGTPGVSVVVPFRNEERNLSALLASIDNQNYKGMIEVVLVDDGSTDGGADVIKKFTPRNENLRVNAIDARSSADDGVGMCIDANARLTSKQRALDAGVGESSHTLILFTDADMILEPTWVESMVNSRLSTGADMVFGHTAIARVGLSVNTDAAINAVSGRIGGFMRKWFVLLESYQLEYLFSFARAFSKLNLTGSCMGNNILVTKEAYAACGGQRGVGYTIVEDRALLALMRKKGFKAVAQEPFTVTAWTYPSRSKGQFVNQMLRWARGGLRPGGGLFVAGMLLLTQNIMFLLSTVWTPPLLTLQCVANFMLTWIFLSISFHKNGSPVSKILFPAHYVFMMAETALFIPLTLFWRKIEWKDRKI